MFICFSQVCTFVAILLKVFIKLDKTFGNLDELDIGNVDKGVEKELKMFIQKVVFTDNSIHVGNGNKIEKSEIGGYSVAIESRL